MADSVLESVFEGFLPEVRRSTWRNPELPAGVHAMGFYAGPPGVAVEVALVAHDGAARVDDLRRAWRSRHGGRATALLLVAGRPGSDEVRVVGLRDAATAATLPRDVVDGVVDQALQATSTESAETTLASLFVEPDDELPRGLRNGGLLASHSLLTTARSGARWSEALRAAPALRTARGLDLLRQLGWEAEHSGQEYLLKDGVHARAVAVLLAGHETFERPSDAHGRRTSPVEHALQIATSREIAWVVAAQGPRLRLYSADPGRGVARAGGAPFVEVDVTALVNDDAAYIPLLFAPAALRGQGAVERLLEDSRDHAVALGQRLRDRVYTEAVPKLAETIARRGGDLSERGLQEAYHCTLVVLFRLLFVAYGEDRGLLPYRTNTVYTGHSVKARARSLVGGEGAFDAAATDMWVDLLAIWSAVANGNSDWGVPAYGGRLFRDDDGIGRTITGLALTNAEIGPVLRAMLVDTTAQGVRGPVDFRSLSVREFGTIYEGLLESSLSVAPADLALREINRTKNVFVPARPGEEVVVHAGGVYFHNASGARKATGSYFTKEFAVEHLLRSALDPTLAEHIERVAGLLEAGRESEAAEAFFDFRVADIAMGSGHFLVAAVDHIAKAMESFLAEHPIPGVMAELDTLRSVAVRQLEEVGIATQGPDAPQITTAHLVRRQVAKRCLYGVDINEIAVDLARVALWIHTFVPGLPMSDLSHGLVHGNSLTGIARLEEALEILEPGEGRSHVGWVKDSLVRDELIAAFAAVQEPLARAARLSEVTVDEAREAEKLHREAQQLLEPASAVMDAAVAGRLGEVDARTKAIAGWDALVAAGRSTVVRERLAELDPIHFPVAFPEVFREGRDGFDVILGNPPWDEVTIEEDKFWGMHDPHLRAATSAEQERRTADLRASRPDLVAELERRKESVARTRRVLLDGPYPGMGTGDPDLYKAFCWQFVRLVGAAGRIGVVLPRSAFATLGSGPWRSDSLPGADTSIFFAVNENEWMFTDVNPGWPVSLVVLRRNVARPRLAVFGPYRDQRSFELGAVGGGTELDLLRLGATDPGFCVPTVASDDGLELFSLLIEHPPIGNRQDGIEARPATELHATNDGKKRFFTGDSTDWPVYNHLNVGHLRFEPEVGPFNHVEFEAVLTELLRRRVKTFTRSDSPMRGTDRSVATDPTTHPLLHPRLLIRDVVHASNPRKVWAALAPARTVLTNKAPYLYFVNTDLDRQAYLLGVLSSATCDWYGHLRINLNLNFFIFNSLPVPGYSSADARVQRLAQLAGRLALGVVGDFGDWTRFGPAVTDDSERAVVLAELDALATLLYRVPDHLLDLIFDGRPTRPAVDSVRDWRARWSRP